MRTNIEIEISLFLKKMLISRFSKKIGKKSFTGFLKMANYLKPILVFKIYY
tara:strand:+ start:56 stop:208 length:153 start_codon:yes stop_codon:yes gene_type:complete